MHFVMNYSSLKHAYIAHVNEEPHGFTSLINK